MSVGTILKFDKDQKLQNLGLEYGSEAYHSPACVRPYVESLEPQIKRLHPYCQDMFWAGQ